jgi:hypothetical protein
MGFFGSFTGSSQRKDIRNANATANQALDQGYAQSQGYYNQAADAYAPYAQQGQKASNTYNALLGLNGADARTEAQGMLTSDPLFQGGLAQESNALLRNLNARGQGGGGQAQLAGARVLQQNYGNWLDRYRDAGTQGFQATAGQAGVRAAQGDNAYGFAATKAGNAIQYGNALASSRNIGINNLSNLLGTAAKAYAAGG